MKERTILTNKDKENLIELYKSGNNIKMLAEKFNIVEPSVRRILRKNGVFKSSTRKITEEEKKYIIDNYSKGISSEKIAKDLNINGCTVCRILKKNDIKIRPSHENKRKYKINDSWLDEIDCQEKAYFLGLMWSDGNVHKNENGFKIALTEKDKDILEKISLLFYNKVILKRYDYNDRYDIDLKPYCIFSVYNKNLTSKLIKLGCLPNKTFVIKYPEWLDEKLHRHFIRGLFDGDGSIRLDKNNRVHVNYTGTIDLLNEMKNIIKNFLNEDIKFKTFQRFPENNNNIYSFAFCKQRQMLNFLNWIYEGSIIHLNRKYEQYLLIKEKVEKSNKIPDRYGLDYIIKYKGNHLAKKYIESLNMDERKKVADHLFNYFRNYGFPYPKYEKEELYKDWDLLKKFNSSNVLIDNLIKTNFKAGLKIFKHFSDHYFDVKINNHISFKEAFDDDELLMKVIYNRLGINFVQSFKITGNMLRQGMRNSFVAGAASIFKPTIAKFIYDKYAPDNGVVYDYAAGFGQRMLGAMACNKNLKYIGVDPWDTTINSIKNIVKFINCENKVELFNVGAEDFCPDNLKESIDLAFSSPPYFDIEIYENNPNQASFNCSYDQFINNWFKKVVNNIYLLLKDRGYFIINIKQSILNDMDKILISFGFNKVEELFMRSSRKKLGHEYVDEPFAIYIKK